MYKLGFKTKGEFQAHYFGTLVQKFFEGGNAKDAAVANKIGQIVDGLSQAWDVAEDHSEE